MPGIDSLITNSLSKEIKNRLDKKVLHQIERKLFIKNGLSIRQSMMDFEKFDNVLKEFLGSGSQDLEKLCINQIYAVNDFEKNNVLVQIKNPNLIKFIMNCLGDEEIVKILDVPINQSYSSSEIQVKTKVPKSSLYRKIKMLVTNGLLVKTKTVVSGSKKVDEYQTIFNRLTINYQARGLEMTCHVDKKIFEDSSIVNVQKRFT